MPHTRVVPTNRDATRRIYLRDEFRNRTGSLHAEWSTLPHYGVAPEEVRREIRQAQVESPTGEIYVVYSYRTPIGWAKPNDYLVHVPRVRYSNTTSRHQSIARGGWWDNGWHTVGESVDLCDPGVVRKGQGRTPFGPQGVW